MEIGPSPARGSAWADLKRLLRLIPQEDFCPRLRMREFPERKREGWDPPSKGGLMTSSFGLLRIED